MSFDFTVKEFILGNGTGTPTFQFYRRGFVLNGSGGSQPSWKDIILSGNTALTLVNAKANGLNYLKLFGDTEQLPETYIDSVTLDGKCEQNGTPTPTVPVDIVCNNGVIKYGQYGKNLFDLNTMDTGHGWWVNGSVVNDTPSANRTIVIDCKPNTVYSFWHTEGAGGCRAFALNKDTIAFGDTASWLTNSSPTYQAKDVVTTITTPADAKKLYILAGRVDAAITRSFEDQLADFMVVEGEVETALPYEPYHFGIHTDGTIETVTDSNGLTATAQMLLSVGDYKDTQEVLSGAVTRNVGIMVLDGTETWTRYATGRFATPLIGSEKRDSQQAPISSHFVGISYNNVPNTDGRVAVFNGSIAPTSGTLGINHQATPETAEFKQYLADQYANGTPVIVVYPTSSATTETVTPQLLQKEPVTVTGSLTGLVANVVSSSHTTPTPTQPLPINTNNGVLKYGPYGKNLFDKSSDIIGKILNDSGSIINESNGFYSANIPVSPNTTYTVSQNSATSGIYLRVLEYNNVDTMVKLNKGTTAGVQDKTFTTSATTKYVIISGLNAGRDTLQLELGSTATEYEPYHFGLHNDGTVETVNVHGKNLFNKNTVSSINPTTSRSDFIRVVPGVVYSMSARGASVIIEYDSEQTQLRTLYIGGTTYTPSADTFFAKFNLLDTYLNTFQLELGSTATEYEPYYYGGQATAEMLLAVGSYQDVQSVLDGNVTRNVGIKVLDGTENVSSTSSYYQITNVINCDITNRVYTICTHYKYGSATNANEFIVLSSGTGLRFNIGSFTSSTDVNAFLADQYANGTPVIVVYPLATPTTETVTGQPLTIQAGTNIVEITQASIDNLELEVSYKAGVEVTVTEIQNAQLDNSVEVTVNG